MVGKRDSRRSMGDVLEADLGEINGHLLEADFWPAVRLVSMHNFRFARDSGVMA
jgi:hypothetical protein